MVNFEEEMKKVGDSNGVKYFKPTEGQHKITFNDDGIKDIAHFKNQKTGEDEDKERVTFAVTVKGEEMAWSVFLPAKVPYGKNSLFAQLMKCGEMWKGLKGKTITLIAMGNGMQRRYVVTEAQDNSELNITTSKIE